MSEIKIVNLRKQFGDFIAVQDSSFTVEDGEFLALLGPPAAARRRRFE